MKDYLYTFLVSISISVTLFCYTLIRTGTIHSLFWQQLFGQTAAFVLGITLLIGPLSRAHQAFSRFIKYRKEIGVMVFVFALFHALFSYVLVFDVFEAGFWTLYLTLPNIVGSLAMLGLLILFMSSRRFIQTRLGNKLWWQIQYKGVRVTAILVFVHIVLASGISSRYWLMSPTSDLLPPPAMLISQFGVGVLFLRFFEWVFPKRLTHVVIPMLILNVVVLMGVLGWKYVQQ